MIESPQRVASSPPSDRPVAMLSAITRLTAPEPGWVAEADVVIVGSGIAGLSAALRIAARGDLRVMVVTKDVLSSGSTSWAQGGIAAALGVDDTTDEHLADTLVAGAGLCEPDAVRVLVDEGPAAVRELVVLGAKFDQTAEGSIALTREGGHHRDRIAHAGGDATGAEIERALIAALDATPAIEVIEHALVLDLARDGASGAISGVTLHVMGEGQRDGVGAVRCRALLLATGGIGQVFAATTNPAVSTGDGVAAALRAGAMVRDLEFVQFHPTVLWLGANSKGQQPLVSEAVRGDRGLDDGLRCGSRLARRAALRAGEVAGAVPHDPGRAARPRDRPGARAHPGCPGPALRIGGHPHRSARAHQRSAPVCLRRVRLHRRARSQPTGLELAAGGPGLRPAHRGGHHPDAAGPRGVDH
jgi:hypothetical protein